MRPFVLVLLAFACGAQEPSFDGLLDRLGKGDAAAGKALVARWKEWNAPQLERLMAAAPETVERIELRRRLGEKIVQLRPDTENVLLRGDGFRRSWLLSELSWARRREEIGDDELRAFAAWTVEKGWVFEPSSVIDSLRVLKLPAFSPIVLQYLPHKEPEVRIQAMHCLAEIKANDAAPRIAEALPHGDPEVRMAALRSLGELRDSSQAAYAGKIVKESGPNDGLARVAMEYLGKVGAREQAGIVAAQLNRDLEIERQSVVLRTLGDLQAAEFAPRIVKVLDKGENPEACLYALGRMGAPQGERVARFLDHADREVRRQALKSLGGMRLRSMVPAVSRRLDDPDEGIRRTAVHALLRMEGVKEASVLHGLLNAERWTRGWAFHALGSLGVVLDGPLLVSQLSRPEAEARAAAAEALGRLRADRYANQVAALLSDTDPWVRNRAAFALGRMEAVKQAEALLPLLEERVQGHLIFAAALAIAEMADKIPEDARRRIIPALEELEKRKSISPYEPAVAGVALSRLGAKDRAAERGVLALLREQFASGGSNWPEFSIAMIDSLSRRFEKEAWERFTRPLTLRRPIENIADYVALMKEAGFGLQASEGLFFDGELYEGSRTTPADALELLTGSDSNASTWDRSWVVLEGNQARLVRIPVALRAWEKRLEEK